MDDKYFAKKIEAKWQKKWAESNTFAAQIDDGKPKFYALEMLPYPSGNLHMGHVRNYSAGDALAWYKRLKGFNVLHPIGWDSFGQPAEDAAVKRGVNPRAWTEDNINVMRGQLERLGLSYDWSRQMYAHRPEYYKFDQWFFIKMFDAGLAYRKMTQVNWCEHDQATLSNEQASGGICWRCGNPVTKKNLEQWFLRTTKYADQLLDDIAEIESGWPGNVLKRQRDWIGRSTGAYVDFEISNIKSQISNKVQIFTTRIDTIYGANAVVVAAEHPIIDAHLNEFPDAVKAKITEIREAKLKPGDHEAEPEKDGIDTGLKAINPFSGEEVPVWVGNYVMMEYGTGAVMSVPAHDERDFDFARKFNLPVRIVVKPQRNGDAEGKTENSELKTDNWFLIEKETSSESSVSSFQPIAEYGTLINSGDWSGKTSEEAKAEMAAYAHTHGFGEAATTYRLRDWGISRQRFWGSPIPIVNCPKCGAVAEKFENLPVELPETAPFTGTGESPLAKVPEFYQTTCPNCGEPATRETDTMDTFVDSSWYFFRYTDPANEILPFDPEVAEYWTPVDQYIGGDDHAVMHLIYTRFWTKVMRDLELVKFDEPVKRLLTQGMVVGETFFDDSTGKRTYFPPDRVTVTRDAKGRITSATVSEPPASAGGDLSVEEEGKRRKGEEESEAGNTGGNATVRERASEEEGEKGRRGEGETNPQSAIRNPQSDIPHSAFRTPHLKYAIERMSKSKGNGVDPDEMVEIYGADAARLFILFAAPIENELVWNESGIEGTLRFLQRVWRLVNKWENVLRTVSPQADAATQRHGDAATTGGNATASERAEEDQEGSDTVPASPRPRVPASDSKALRRKTHQTIKRVTDAFESLQFNTPVAGLMELSNAISDFPVEPANATPEDLFAVREALTSLVLMLTPYAPHTAEELHAVLVGNENGILANGAAFPVSDPELAKADEIEIPVQVNGKLRSRVMAAPDTANDELQSLALADEKVKEIIAGKDIVKTVVVPNRLVNIVVKG